MLNCKQAEKVSSSITGGLDVFRQKRKAVFFLMLFLLLCGFTATGNAAPNLLNGGFEYPDVAGYEYGPSGSDWSFTGSYVIADSGSAWGNTAYEGNQNMAMQGVVSVYQAVSGFEVGKTYTVTWAEADRPSSGGNDFRVLFDSTEIYAAHTAASTSWEVRTSAQFTATSTTHTLEFEAFNTGGGDKSVFIDAIIITEVTPLAIYNTGVDDNENALGDRVLDPHWTLTSSPDPTYNGPETYTVKSDEFPIPPWMANTSTSMWICPRQDATEVAAGVYVYQLQFNLTGYDPDTADIDGQFSSDDSVTNVKINGVSTGINGAMFDVWHNFGISSGFVTGINTLEFLVNNGSAGPSGLRVELTVTADLITAKASNPSPSNGATFVSVDADLSWTAGYEATSHDVYFGQDSTPDAGEFQGNQGGTTFDPGTMDPNTTYYWCIDEINAYGTTLGDVWSFTTGSGAYDEVGKWRRYVVTLDNSTYSGNPFELEVDATFTHTSTSTELTLPGYYDGSDQWKIGFMPTKLGEWTYVTSSTDADLNNQTGALNCVPSGLPGILKADSSHPKKWKYADGPYAVPIIIRGKFIQESASTSVMTSVADFMATNNIAMWNFSCTDEDNYGGRNDYFFTGSWGNHQFDLPIWQRLNERLDILAEQGLGVHIFLYDDDAGAPGWGGQSSTERLVIRWVVARTCGYPVILYNSGIDIPEYRSGSDINWMGQRYAEFDPYEHPRASRDSTPNTSYSMANRTYDSWCTPQQAYVNNMVSYWGQISHPGTNDDAYGENRGTHPEKDHTPSDIRRAFWKSLIAGGQGGQIRGGGDGFSFGGFYSLHYVESDLESEQWLKYINPFIEDYPGDTFGEMVPVASLADNSNKQYAIADASRSKIVYWKTSSSDTYDPDSHNMMEVKLSGVSSSLIYDATWFDPRNGNLTSEGTLNGGSDYSLSPPSSQTDDWVLYLELEPIDRYSLASRHNPVINSADSLSPLSVGNGGFTFTADITGLQSFPDFYSGGIPLCIQSDWGWHTFDNPNGYNLADILVEVDTYGRMVKYATVSAEHAEACEWLRSNPHRLGLARVGLKLKKSGGSEAVLSDCTNIDQELDLWRGVLTSRFKIEGQDVQVETCCHPTMDMIAVRIESDLISADQLSVTIEFPYGSSSWGTEPGDWNNPLLHETTIIDETATTVDLRRTLDDDLHYVTLEYSSGAEFDEVSAHHYELDPAADSNSFEFMVAFSEEAIVSAIPGFSQSLSDVEAHWQNFWNTGGAIDLSASTNPQADELERRIVLSQYLTAIQCAGTMPPAETGLTCNSWYGTPHLEMHWWHGVHFTLWGRSSLFEQSLDWYETILPKAQATATLQGYTGARWPKMVGPEGEENPSSIGTFVLWQQPHPIYYAELGYREHPNQAWLEQYDTIVFETAEFIASFMYWKESEQRYILGPPIMPAQERYTATSTYNPTFELEYWLWGLQTAQLWRERLGLGRNTQWDDVIDNFSQLPVSGGLYLANESTPDTWTNDHWNDHPSMLMAYGFLNGGRVNVNTMSLTLDEVMAKWDWSSTWGWDYPMIAMTAARVGEPQTAIDVLLMATGKNTYLTNGHNYQNGALPIYLPGNGGLLSAVAMMSAGWDGAPEGNAPGFPDDGTWNVRWEGLKPMP